LLTVIIAEMLFMGRKMQSFALEVTFMVLALALRKSLGLAG